MKRDRALVNSAVATLFARGISAIATVTILAISAHSLTKPQLGVVAVLTLLSAFLAFGDFGLGTLLMTRLPEAHARDDLPAKQEVVGVTLSTLCVTGGVIMLLGAVLTFILPWQSLLGAHQLPGAQVRAAVLTFFVFGGIGIPATVGSRILASMLRSATAQIWLVASSMLALGMTVACAELHLPIWAYVFAIAGGPTAVALVQTVWVLVWVFPDLRPHRLGVHPNVAWTFLRASSYFAIMSLSAVVSYSIDSLVVSAVLGASVAAVFALAARMFTLVGVTVGLAGQQMWSALSDAITRGDHAWARVRFWHTLFISTGITTFACGLLVVFGRQLSRVWVGSHLIPPLSLLIVLAVYTVYSTTILQASYLLAAVGRVKTFALIGVGGAIVNLVTSIWLTHVYGLTGPILGSIFAFFAIVTVPLTILLRRELRALD